MIAEGMHRFVRINSFHNFLKKQNFEQNTPDLFIPWRGGVNYESLIWFRVQNMYPGLKHTNV